ncbi:hypothetical protein [Paenibacillus sp. JCM 10914]|uniref:hypothetical protein n=1 Tax=Paenibacillus sp. JCM 10914 TaxID=1236974 RepID=UPI0003CC2FE6|nr:hypothetical protein [Paenibacillus sp. JCM 10914]GAE07329.1 hypothetical protein JCM10914_3552 [Paenibacillus sp. JCM 10914]
MRKSAKFSRAMRAVLPACLMISAVRSSDDGKDLPKDSIVKEHRMDEKATISGLSDGSNG